MSSIEWTPFEFYSFNSWMRKSLFNTNFCYLLSWTLVRFAQKVDQKKQMIQRDRTRWALSNEHVFSWIPSTLGWENPKSVLIFVNYLLKTWYDSLRKWTKRNKWYTEIELDELYRMNTFSAEFHQLLAEKILNQC